MKKDEVYDSLIYLDKEYISAKYEAIAGYNPETSITKTEGLNAGIKFPILSAGASSVETKSYKLSTTAMLSRILEEILKLNEFSTNDHGLGQRSKIAWVKGNLFVSKVTVTRSAQTFRVLGKPKDNEGETKKQIAEENYFQIRGADATRFALLTTPDYFFSGIDSFRDLLGTVVDLIDIPVRALLRIHPSKSAFEEWIATPLLIIEDEN